MMGIHLAIEAAVEMERRECASIARQAAAFTRLEVEKADRDPDFWTRVGAGAGLRSAVIQADLIADAIEARGKQ